MSDIIKHECGIALVRLLKPLSYYLEKYGTITYGLNKLYLLMEKQHNRGQDGAGVATIKLHMPPGQKYISRYRSNDNQPIKEIFSRIFSKFEHIKRFNPDLLNDVEWLKTNVSFTGEVLLGHLRYGTHGDNRISACHPFLRQNNWMTRNLILAGNFNLTNVDELFGQLVELGQFPKEKSDTVTVLEKIGHFLDMENQNLFDYYKEDYSKKEITEQIAKNLNIGKLLSRAAKDFDGGYTMVGMIGHGDAFVLRDPIGIRPAFYYCDDEIVVAASERPAIQTAFNVKVGDIQELGPGNALIIKRDGTIKEENCRPAAEQKSCSFERIYFSRGNDSDIYEERKRLGYQLAGPILEEVNDDFDNTVFSYIPNTAETAFLGLMHALQDYLKDIRKQKILELGNDISDEKLEKILALKARIEKLALKDIKLRTFITEDVSRDELVAHVYDITYGTVREEIDSIVVLDDSIVRGTTLKKSILRILDRLGPKKIVIVSSAPQIRYPDCYGIDMSKLKDFVAFRAAIALIQEANMEDLIDEVYFECKHQLTLPKNEVRNVVKKIYKPFTVDQISDKIAELLKPSTLKAELKIIYQSIEGLHKACPNHKGDWYFSGDFPTQGGNIVVNKAFINFYEKVDARAY